MDPLDLKREIKRRTDISGKDVESAWRRQVWLQIYLPLAIGLFMILMLIALIVWSQTGDASVWADLSLVLLFIAAIVFGFLGLMVLVAATIGVIYLTRLIPPPFDQTRKAVLDAQRSVEQASQAAAQPIIAPRAASHAFVTGVRYLAGIFRS